MPGLRNARPAHSAPPINFPSTDPEWELGQTTVHYALCAALRSALFCAVGDEDFVATDLFVYFDPDDAYKKCAPDGFVKRGVPREQKDVWRTWLDGIPELCIEILSSSDREVLPLSDKLARYTLVGTNELVTFDPNAPLGRRLRAWDRRHHTLVERAVSRERTPCRTLGMWFVVAPAPANEALQPSDAFIDALRLARDPDGRDLVLTAIEQTRHERAGKDEALRTAERERKAAERERAEKNAALAEIKRLRARLADESHPKKVP